MRLIEHTPVVLVTPDKVEASNNLTTCTCRGTRHSMCLCLKAGVRCGCSATKASEWTRIPLAKTGKYVVRTEPSTTMKLRAIYIGTSWCQQCVIQQTEFERMRSAATPWKITNSKTAHIQVLDGDTSAEARNWAVTAYPTLILVNVRGQELSRRVGYQSSYDILEWWNQFK